jgi:hypothetical protein
VTKFREQQRFPLWAELILVVPFLGIGLGMLQPDARQDTLWAAFAGLAAAIGLLYLLLFRMSTEVDDQEIRVHFGYIPSYRWRLPIYQIVKAMAVEYNPIREYGGWGIRGIPVRALNARGRLGVLLTLPNGRTMLIGSQRPDLLLQAITKRSD